MEDYSFRGVVVSKEKSDCACWGVTKAKGPLERLYFKLPELLDDEVRIKVSHVGLCHTDCYKIDEDWFPNMVYPMIPGHEIVAVIEKVGKNVKKFKVGDDVCFGVFRDSCGSCPMCLSGNDQLCIDNPYKVTYDPYLGGYSTVMHVKADWTYHLPAALPKHTAAPILCAGSTVFPPLKRWCVPGGRCGVVGIGGLGHMAIKIATKMGMQVVAFSTTPAKEMDAKSYGAKEFVCSKNEEEMKRLMTKDRLDLMINTAVVKDIGVYMSCVRPSGTFIQVASPPTSVPVTINNMDCVSNQKIFTGSAVGSRLEVAQTLDFCAKYDCNPVCENFSWADFPKAYDRLKNGQARYRCVVDIASTFDE